MNREQLEDLFQDMIEKIEQRMKLYGFIVFGSRARGNFLEHSDFDIIIIANFQEKYIDRSEWIVHKAAPNLAMDILCYTPDEFDEMFNNYRLIAIDAIDEGIILRGNKYLEKYKQKLQEFKQRGLKKEDNVLYPPH